MDFIRRSNRRDTLTAMADATGGRAILDTNDFGGALARLETELNTYYSLGYQPRRKGEREDHRIEVRVKRKGLRAGGRKPPAKRSVVPIRVTGDEYLSAFENPFRYGFKLVLTPGTRRLALGILDEVGGGYSILYRELAPEIADP